jgi:hypothetical protein
MGRGVNAHQSGEPDVRETNQRADKPPPSSDRPPRQDLAERCRIHAGKMDSEGWYVTANVLDAAADEIERLRALIARARPFIARASYGSTSDAGHELRRDIDR